MKTIIAGSRDITDIAHVERAIAASQFCITRVVSGGARGVDSLAIDWALEHEMPYQIFDVPGYAWAEDIRAGHKRNAKMARYADALVAVWDGKSRGTKDMVARARRGGLLVYVYRVPPED